jgi:outer membrane protein
VSALSLLAPFAAANAAPDLRVGVVDMQRALEESKAGQEAQKQYQDEVKRAQTDIDAKKADLERRQQTYQKQKTSLNQKALEEKQEELIGLEKELKRSFQDQQDALRRKNNQLVGELIKKLRKVVDDYGKDSGYSLILEKGSQSVLFADNSVEITDAVIKRFNAAQ